MPSEAGGVHLSITPISAKAVPTRDDLLVAAKTLLDSTSTWKPGKSYWNGRVKSLSRPQGPNDGAAWHCRVSEHPKEEGTIAQFWQGLGVNKPEQERKFIPDLKRVTRLAPISTSQEIWSMYYTFPPPVSPRVFPVLITTHFDEATQTGWVVSLPVDVSTDYELGVDEKKAVLAQYVSVERLMPLPNGSLEWRMATSSNPAGLIPKFVTELSMAGKIADDVPHFIHYLESQNKAEANGAK